MRPERWQDLKQLFQQLLGLDEPARREVLAQTGREDPELQRELEHLLAAHAEAASFMESPPMIGDRQATPEAEPEAIRGRRIGPYEIVREIGRGGMGTVYLAVRADGQFRKQVALKLIKRGMDSDVVLRRFRNERQILAQLDHPNIARLLDGGTSDDGLPFFVMDYIEGQRLDDYCDEHRLSVRERLQLFCLICTAIQYAHQNLVIHRDLKPSNILVTRDGTPKLLDFGVAKLLNPELSGTTWETTVAEMRPMTPEFASPEQLQGQILTTASDVYSLGLVLYVLLTGRLPYTLTTISTPAELIRMICEQEPERPSAAVLAADPQADQARNDPARVVGGRDVDRETLKRTLVGDLDNIVLRALRKDPMLRYPSAEQLADDIRRYLQGLPVLARPSTFGYRAAKFVRRHRAGMSAALVILVTLIAGLIVTSWQAHIARRERARADRSLADVRRLANSFLFEFHEAIANLPGSTPARLLVVKRAREYLDRLANEPGADRDLDLQDELATAYDKLGSIQGLSGVANLGDTTGALESFERAFAIRTALARAKPNDAKTQAALAVARHRLCHIADLQGDHAGARRHCEEAVRIAETALAVNPSAKEVRIALIEALDALGDISITEENLERTIGIRRRTLQLGEELAASAPEDAKQRRAVAVECKKLGAALEKSGDLSHAIELYRRALAIDQERVAAEPNNGRARLDLSYSFGSLGFALFHSGDLSQALENYSRALALREALAQADPTNANAQFAVASALGKIGAIHRKAKNWQSGLDAYRRAMAIFDSLASADPKDAALQFDLASYSKALGEFHLEWASTGELSPTVLRSRLQEAHRWLQRGQTIYVALQQRNPADARNRKELEQNTAKLAECDAALAMNGR